MKSNHLIILGAMSLMFNATAWAQEAQEDVQQPLPPAAPAQMVETRPAPAPVLPEQRESRRSNQSGQGAEQAEPERPAAPALQSFQNFGFGPSYYKSFPGSSSVPDSSGVGGSIDYRYRNGPMVLDLYTNLLAQPGGGFWGFGVDAENLSHRVELGRGMGLRIGVDGIARYNVSFGSQSDTATAVGTGFLAPSYKLGRDAEISLPFGAWMGDTTELRSSQNAANVSSGAGLSMGASVSMNTSLVDLDFAANYGFNVTSNSSNTPGMVWAHGHAFIPFGCDAGSTGVCWGFGLHGNLVYATGQGDAPIVPSGQSLFSPGSAWSPPNVSETNIKPAPAFSGTANFELYWDKKKAENKHEYSGPTNYPAPASIQPSDSADPTDPDGAAAH